MKKYSHKIKILLLSALVLAAAVLGTRTVTELVGLQDTQESIEKTELSSAEFCLRDCGGYIAVFSAYESRAPLEVTDISVAALNDRDRELLKSGIPARDRLEVLRLLEDFGS